MDYFFIQCNGKFSEPNNAFIDVNYDFQYFYLFFIGLILAKSHNILSFSALLSTCHA